MGNKRILYPSEIIDRLYGRLEITPGDLKLFQTKELTRQRCLSLSAQPPEIINAGMCDTRFNHAVGVAHLGKIVGSKLEFQDIAKDLYFAALSHDIALPPFSHSSEYFQIKFFGKDHMELASEVLDGTELASEIENQGGNLDAIVDLVRGTLPPYSDLLNGTIDIDNLDNVLRYATTMGLLEGKPYSPEKIAQAFGLIKGTLVFLPGVQEELENWEKTRKSVYDYVDGPVNRAAATMIYRGLSFAYDHGELQRNFFYMTDSQAFDYLKNKCNPKTGKVFGDLERWILYQQAFEFTTTTPSEGVAAFLGNSDNRTILADELAEELDIEPENVCVYTGKGKGVRHIHIPILDQRGNSTHHPPLEAEKWMARVFIHPSHLAKTPHIQEYMSAKLS